ncbi:hypothetical protein Nepgr_010039 [Nepenthes gracilis]|uniref:Transcription termination factor MTEF18, mitochondrial-like n=1 Tax=Nepenthes gracilis TaxID=150966 RepID=A0AAD3SC82_NEPGR|nr:hypothetical protein Nepgr_010039 [Nepenthes gracilis]
MTRWRKLVELPILGWISYQMSANSLMSLKYTMLGNTGRCKIAPNHRYYGRKALATEINRNLDETSTSNRENVSRVSRAVIREAQAALLDYLHSTRSFQFMDAEHISRNSPNFLRKLLGKVENEPNTTRSLARFFRYHPVNEFEPFFESIGLDASEFIPLLPRDLMFLSDDVNMLENYHVLCDYGIPRNRIGKIYKEATEVFRYDYGVLQSKLQAYEGLGLSQSTVAMVVCSSPYLLFGDVNEDFRQVLGLLNCLGFECDWFQGHLLVENSYNWRQIFELLCMLSDLGCSKEQLGSLISQHPELLFERTGSRTFSVIGFLVKFGSTKNDIYSMFLRFPQIPIDKFVWNLRNGFHFLAEIEMDVEDVGKIISSHAALLGSCSLKKTNSLLANLNIGKKRLSRAIKDNTDVLKNWVIGAKVKKLPSDGVEERSRIRKIEFLRNIGFAENSKEMAKALKVFRGKGLEIQERFDCLVKAGLDRKDVVRMVKVSPQILNQTKEVIEKKIDFLVNGLGYPITSLVAFPSYISYTIQRVKLRHSMYQWLNERGTATSGLALSTIMACTDKIFMRTYVNQHPKGPKVWQELKTKIYSV